MEIEEGPPSLLSVVLSLKHLSYNYTSVTIDPVNDSKVLSQTLSEVLGDYARTKESRNDDRLSVALEYPERVTLDCKLFRLNRSGLVDQLLNEIELAGLSCESSSGRSKVTLGNKYSVMFYLEPYSIFSTGNAYAANEQKSVSLSVVRESNSVEKQMCLNFEKKKYQHLNTKYYDSNNLGNEFKLSIGWSDKEVESGQFQVIQDRILNALKTAAQAIVEADKCGQVTPGQRGKHSVCKSCDLQLSCITSKRG